MGDSYQTIVDLDASATDAEHLARQVLAGLVEEGVVLADRTDCVLGRPLGHPPGPNWERAVTDDWDQEPWDGLAVHTSRTGFTSGADLPGAAVCPHCVSATPLDDRTWPGFHAAMRTWHDTGAASVDCPGCTAAVALPDWSWDECPMAFGHLGFEFWNWPDLTDDFRARLSELLGGHRTAYVWGQI
ncbi:hypothetical protein [Streptomyces sp. CA-179760]|uniref:hypothetical protein n=1 Tax=Streptomyces sp. CA-179760 TaxID=3240054 RepID=UPI003D8B4D44